MSRARYSLSESKSQRIALSRALTLGDLLCAVPAIRAIAHARLLRKRGKTSPCCESGSWAALRFLARGKILHVSQTSASARPSSRRGLSRVADTRPVFPRTKIEHQPNLHFLATGRSLSEIALIGLPWAREFAERSPQYFSAFLELPRWPGLPEQPVDGAAMPAFLRVAQNQKCDLPDREGWPPKNRMLHRFITNFGPTEPHDVLAENEDLEAYLAMKGWRPSPQGQRHAALISQEAV